MKKGKTLPPGGGRRRGRRVWILLGVPLGILAVIWGYYHYRFYRLHRAIVELKTLDDSTPGLQDLRGVIHAHTAAGGHSVGTLDQIVEAAREAGVDFVVITEHNRPHAFSARYEQAPGTRPILIFGEEREEGTARVLVAAGPGGEALRVAAHWMSGPQEGVAEVINLHEEAEQAPRLFAAAALLGSLPGYSGYFLLPVQRVFRDKLEQWDEILRRRRLWAVAGNDSHANTGLRLQYSSGKPLLDFTIDKYADSFRYLSTHVLLPKNQTPSPANILNALANGSSYVCFDFLHPPKGFLFVAKASAAAAAPAPAAAARAVPAGATLAVRSPVPARIRLLRDGGTLRESPDARGLEEKAAKPGVYRVELYLPQLGPWAADTPWVISNPIFVGEVPVPGSRVPSSGSRIKDSKFKEGKPK